MMALGRWPFSPAEIRAMIETPLSRDFYAAGDMFFPRDPWPHIVYYRKGKVTYVPSDHFLFTDNQRGPSDCIWIVSGTAERRA